MKTILVLTTATSFYVFNGSCRNSGILIEVFDEGDCFIDVSIEPELRASFPWQYACKLSSSMQYIGVYPTNHVIIILLIIFVCVFFVNASTMHEKISSLRQSDVLWGWKVSCVRFRYKVYRCAMFHPNPRAIKTWKCNRQTDRVICTFINFSKDLETGFSIKNICRHKKKGRFINLWGTQDNWKTPKEWAPIGAYGPWVVVFYFLLLIWFV